MELRVALVRDGARPPQRAHDGDAGLDLFSVAELTLAPGERATVPTGIAIEVPPGHAGLVLPRSGLAARHGIALVNAPGLIDSGYRGEVRVLLLNTDRSEPFTISPGDRIAQLLVVPFAEVEAVAVERLALSARGEGGFGSTGR
jgi:dUTP diphosphatase